MQPLRPDESSGRDGELNGCSEFHGGCFRGLRSLSHLHSDAKMRMQNGKAGSCPGANFTGAQQSCVPKEELLPVWIQVLETLIS